MERKVIISDYIKSEIMRNRDAQLDENEDLFGTGILDSLSLLKLVAFIENAFGIEVPDADVVYENFHSLNAMANYLQQPH